MKKLILLAGILSLYCCRPSIYAPYAFTTAQEYQLHQGEGITDKFLVIEDDYSPELIDWINRLKPNGYISDLPRSHKGNFEKALTNLNEMERIYFSGLVYLLREDYLKASAYFEKCFKDFNMPQAGLLYAESYQIYLAKSLPDSDFEAYPIYQQAYDYSHDNPTLKALIEKRFKYYQSGL